MKYSCACRAGEKWDKQHGVGVERAELVARTRDAVARGQQLGHVWHAATHIEHARPMLQVLGKASMFDLIRKPESHLRMSSKGPAAGARVACTHIQRARPPHAAGDLSWP